MDKLLLELVFRMALALESYADEKANGPMGQDFQAGRLRENMRRIRGELLRLVTQVEQLGKEEPDVT